MPQLYEYLGVVIYFWSKEHEPIHVHGQYQGTESRAEFVIENGKITTIVFKNVSGKKPLPKKQLADFKVLVETFSHDIKGKWEAYFQDGVKPQKVRITRRLQ